MRRFALTAAALFCAVTIDAASTTCVGLRVDGKPNRRISASEASFIDVSLLFPASTRVAWADGNHVVAFRFVTPRGFLYQESLVAFTADEKQRSKRQTVKGLPEAVKPELMREEKGGSGGLLSVSTSLPVAGSPIINNSLYGEWRVEATVDDAAGACAELRFTVAQ